MDSAIDRAPARLAPLSVVGDTGLARLAARGDEAAFAQVFRRYHQPLYRYCRAITGNSEDAADAVQNTMVKSMRALPGERRQIELKPWLFRVAHNEAVSLLRARRSQTALEEGHGGAVDGPEAGLASREDLRELIADLSELPERQRATVILRELNGLSFAEIASVFATSTAAAKQAAYDGRVALQDYAKGRAMNCDAAMRAISDGDGKLRMSRKLRGHLRACEECASFKAALDQRRGQLAAIAPALPATAVAALMQKLFGGGGSIGGSAGGGAVGISAAGGKLVAGAGALKGTTAIVAATVATTAALGSTHLTRSERAQDSKSEPSAAAAAAGAKALPSKPNGSSVGAERRQLEEGADARERSAGPGDPRQQAEGRPDHAEPAGLRTRRPGAAPLAPDSAPTRRPQVADERREAASVRRPEAGERASRGERPSTPTAGAPTVPERPLSPELPAVREPQGAPVPDARIAPTPPQISPRAVR